MAFKADPSSIRDLGDTVRGLVDDADRAVEYVTQYLGIGYGDGRMFIPVVEQATAVREALVANYRHLAELAGSSGRELGRAADRYQDSDRAEQERLDRTYRVPEPR